MKIMNSINALLLAFVLVNCSNSTFGQNQWPRDFQNVGASFFEFGAKAYDRPGDDVGFPVLTDSVTNAILLESGDLTDLGGGAGAEVRFGSIGRRGRKWEVRTFLTNWSDEFNFEQPNLISPLAPGLDLDVVDILYDSELFSVEFSLKRQITPGVTLLWGPRFVSFNEELNFGTETEILTPPVGTFDLDSDNSIETRNALLGGQVGALINIPISRDIYINGFIRSGGFLNFVEMRTVADTTASEPIANTIRRNTGSFVGEAGGKVYFDAIPGSLSFFLGYEATWIDNVALAPVQAQTLTPTEITTGVTPFFHAVTFGAQYRR